MIDGLVNQICVIFIYRKQLGDIPIFKTIFNAIMFPMFDIIGLITTYIALFKKVEWKPIPHDVVVDTDDLKAKE